MPNHLAQLLDAQQAELAELDGKFYDTITSKKLKESESDPIILKLPSPQKRGAYGGCTSPSQLSPVSTSRKKPGTTFYAYDSDDEDFIALMDEKTITHKLHSNGIPLELPTFHMADVIRELHEEKSLVQTVNTLKCMVTVMRDARAQGLYGIAGGDKTETRFCPTLVSLNDLYDLAETLVNNHTLTTPFLMQLLSVFEEFTEVDTVLAQLHHTLPTGIVYMRLLPAVEHFFKSKFWESKPALSMTNFIKTYFLLIPSTHTISCAVVCKWCKLVSGFSTLYSIENYDDDQCKRSPGASKAEALVHPRYRVQRNDAHRAELFRQLVPLLRDVLEKCRDSAETCAQWCQSVAMVVSVHATTVAPEFVDLLWSVIHLHHENANVVSMALLALSKILTQDSIKKVTNEYLRLVLMVIDTHYTTHLNVRCQGFNVISRVCQLEPTHFTDVDVGAMISQMCELTVSLLSKFEPRGAEMACACLYQFCESLLSRYQRDEDMWLALHEAVKHIREKHKFSSKNLTRAEACMWDRYLICTPKQEGQQVDPVGDLSMHYCCRHPQRTFRPDELFQFWIAATKRDVQKLTGEKLSVVHPPTGWMEIMGDVPIQYSDSAEEINWGEEPEQSGSG